ncbi:MAG TPA: hypothetical protein DF296_00090 [Candidatus Margulisbacteria bacterium]|nr:MAG: hypothetical protein A2X43_11680 [Candidatus Margulisbacteria bacterium GWD2_39_127]OGI01800.1 MAG: hypothetical protein A2X42_04205 [Candidatus Margulisbacteria bacterium GWF2_38_17]OGI10122.1 MAG: hypothetical protein A2X41_00925 [Candidatus Margulisbacteria bacterium GWE2_39_32]HAR63786.1 hypothetical protein [Candidatus Margulisiibacteriota bacterium]HCT83581.1 hypothetical protein [Candidatus Margulisiibacteriota bacterium]
MKNTKETVMIVDDDRFQLSSMQKILQSDYDTVLCKDGKEAIENYKKNTDKVKTIILDIRLPDMDGFEVFDKIRDINIEVPIIFITGYQDKYDTLEVYKNFRPHGYITKNGANEIQMIKDTLKAAVDYYNKILEIERLKIEKLSQEIEKKYAAKLLNISREIQSEIANT